MSDIFTRLLLDTKDFESKLGKAKNSTNDFSSNISGKVVGAVGKFAGAIGLAVGGLEGFKKIVDRTQTSGDLMRSTIHSMKVSVEEFFYSVNKGNLSTFITNLGTIAARAKEAYGALDQLGNTQISYGVLSAKNQASIAEAQYLAKNKFAPTTVRIGGFGMWGSAIQSEEANIKALQRELVNAAVTAVQARTNANIEITLDDLIRAFEVDLKDPSSRALSKSRAYNGMSNYEVNAKRKDWTQEQKDALAESQKQNIITYTMLEKYNDEQLAQIGQQIQQYYLLTAAVRGLGREYNETANEFNNANKGVAGFTPIQSLSGYTVYSGTSEASKNFKGTSSSGKGKAKVEFPVVIPQVQYGTELGMKVLQWMSGKDIQPIKVPIEIEEENIDEEAIPKKVKENKEYQYSVLDVADAIGSLTGTFSDGASTAASYFSNVVSGVLQASAAIAALIPLKKMEANANAEVAVTGAAASAASTPIVGWLMAGAAVASVIAAITNIPKYAEGGVVGGSSFIGDKLIARVNSGETILTQKQSARALSMMDGGNNVRVTGDVRLSGKDIYVSLRNYMKSSGNKL